MDNRRRLLHVATICPACLKVYASSATQIDATPDDEIVAEVQRMKQNVVNRPGRHPGATELCKALGLRRRPIIHVVVTTPFNWQGWPVEKKRKDARR